MPAERRAATAGAALIVAALVGVGWVASRHETRAPAQRVVLAPPLQHEPHGEPDASGVEPAASGAGDAAADANAIEVCGFGRQALPSAEAGSEPQLSELDWPELDAAVADATRRISAQLGRDADPRRRALGLWLLDGHEALHGPQPGEPARVGSARGDLVRMALGTRDPEVYRLAWSACRLGIASARRSSADDDGCPRLDAAQWARLDPDNALPWVHALAAAGDATSRASIDEALYRIGQSRRFDDGFGRATDAALALDVDGLAPGVQAQAALAAVDLDALIIPTYAALNGACAAAALADANRRALCDAVATRMVDSATSLLPYRLGIGLGKRLGWSDARIDALERQSQEMMARMREGVPAEPLSCDGVPALRSYFRRVAELGELGAARETRTRPPQ